MTLHRPSLLIGATSTVGTMIVVLLLLATPGFAINWPWSPPSNKEPKTVKVSGSVSCSSVTSLSDGYGGSPASLTMTAGNLSKTLQYPFKLQHSRFGSIYRPPHFTGYEFTVTIPAKSDKATVRWHLECRDQNGKPGSKHDGGFTVARKDLSRTICSYSGLTNPCIGKEIHDKAASCAFSVLTAGIDSDALALAAVIDDATDRWTLQDYLNASGLAHPLIGIIVGCVPLVLPPRQPGPDRQTDDGRATACADRAAAPATANRFATDTAATAPGTPAALATGPCPGDPDCPELGHEGRQRHG